jgi:hypothetical protein
MASEARRAARALVERRVERFESRHGAGESQARLAAALAALRVHGRVVFTSRWITQGAAPVLEAEFAPPARTRRFLKATSVVITLLLAATLWAIVSPSVQAPLAYLLGLSTGLAILALPLVFVALGSNREAEEARIRKAIRVALADEDAAYPKRQRWSDED